MKKTMTFALLLSLALIFSGCGTKEETAPDPTVEPEPQAETSTNTDSETGTPEGEEILAPIYASDLKDGSYLITVDSSSSMFRVIRCELIVENGAMQAVMTMSGDGYGMVYMGTGEEALLDSEENYVPFVLDDGGAKTFTVPVEALDMELDCAAWSIRKEKWYDRTLIFQSAGLPAHALVLE